MPATNRAIEQLSTLLYTEWELLLVITESGDTSGAREGSLFLYSAVCYNQGLEVRKKSHANRRS